MPELPEVESVRRTLRKAAGGARVESVDLRRQDIVEGERTAGALLVGCRIVDVVRHGKQLAIIGQSAGSSAGSTGDQSRVVCVHLGMTGSVRVCDAEDEFERGHVHIVWKLEGGKVMGFRDPRRFGGVWTFDGMDALRKTRWGAMGPDALEATEAQLATGLADTRRAVKAALLDQALIAGLGNIYVDELLFRSRVNPMTLSHKIQREQVALIWRNMRAVLDEAIQAGGSSVRDYVDASGSQGGFQLKHQVYGRGGQSCVTCGTELKSTVVGGRTTVFCPKCQPRRK